MFKSQDSLTVNLKNIAHENCKFALSSSYNVSNAETLGYSTSSMVPAVTFLTYSQKSLV